MQEKAEAEIQRRNAEQKDREPEAADKQGVNGVDSDVQTPPKWSLCTWWQKKQKEKGISKKDALETWRKMTDAEKQAFKETIPCPSPEPSPQKPSPSPPQPPTAVTSLEGFAQKWKQFRQGLQGAQNSNVFHLANWHDSFFLYADIVSLVRLRVFDTALAAEQALKEYCVNRKKISNVQKWLEANGNTLPEEVPPEFCARKVHKGVLTLKQKEDLLTHVKVMHRSNCVFTSRDAKKSMWKCLRWF